MQHKQTNLLALLAGLGRYLKQKFKPVTISASSVPTTLPAEMEDWLKNLPSSPDSRGINVQEVGSVEFVREWGRTVAMEALVHAKKGAEKVVWLERRLPDFDRRLPNKDRRAGEHLDQRVHSEWSEKPSAPSADSRGSVEKLPA
jgi:hypothetical protein